MADSEDQNHLFDATERFHDPHEALRQLFEAWLARTHTAHPVVAESHDPKTNTVDGNVAIKLATLKEGEIQWNAIPKITMPTLHLGGGGMAITIPVAKGDEGLAVFASRSIDNWFTQGGIQSQFASRMHDLSDGFFIPGFRSVPQALPSVDTTSMQMRTTDGKTNFSFNPTGGGSMTMTAPNNPTAINGKGFNTDVENSHQKASGQITLDTPMTKATGKVDASQGFFVNGVPIGSGGGGGGGGGGGSPGPNPPAAPVVGNFWWDSIGGQLYVWYDDGNSAQWVAATNQTGPPGAPGPPGPPDGNTIWNGSGGPTVAIGENGDFYIDNLAHVIYGPKTLGAWPTPGISLIGPAGAPGAPGSTGPRGPAGPAGADSTVPGPPGAIGPQGPNGPQGVAGPTGPQGPQGVQGNIGAQGPQGSMGPQGPQGDTGAMGPQGVYQTGPGLFLNTGTTPPTIDVATPYLPLTGGTLSGALIGTSFQGPHQGTVGAVTPNTGAFTMLTASGTVSGAGFIALLSPYAPLASPVFTGVPSLPTGAIGITQTAGTSNTSLATTAFVTAAITAAPNKTITITGDIAGSGTTAIVTTLPVVNANVGTFNNISVNAKGQVIGASNSTYITGNQTITISGDATGTGTTAIPLLFATVNANVGTFQGLTINAKGLVTAASNQNYAPLASPLFTGNPQAPTPLTADNSISIATTAWVKAQGYTGGSGVYLPLTGGTISGNLTVSGGVLTLNNGTSNWIYTPGLGYASPSFGTRSVGTKFVLFDGLGTTSADYALGIEGGTMWLSVPLTTNAFNWYGGTTLAMTLYGTGNLLLHGTLTLTNATQASVIFNNTVPAITAGGLWRFTVGTGGNMNLTANTAAAGDFSTSTTSFYSTPTGIFYYGNPAFATFTPAGGGAGALLLTGAGGGAVAANGLAVKGISGGGEINLIPGSSVNTGYIEWRLPNAAVGAGARHAYLGWNSGTTFGLQLETATVFAISGALAITDPTTNSLTSLNLSAVNDGNGVNFKMTGNGATIPSKTIRVLNGNLEIVNNAYTAVPFQLTDAGNLTVGGQITAGGTYLYFSNATGNVNAAGGCFFFSDQNNTIAHLGTGNGAFAVQNTSGSQIHTFNANGNATHSGNVAAANIFLTSNWITFAGGSGTNNGPGIAGDATNFTMRMGTGNGGFYIQNNAGTVNYHVFTVDGNASHNGLLTTGTGVTANGGAFQKLGGGPCYRMSPATNNTSIGSMWYTDTSNMYLLLTNNNDAWGTWNGLRPLTVTLSNGNITFGHGVYCNTGLTMTTSTASNVIQCNNGSNWLQLFDDGNGHIECNTNLWLNGNNTGNQVIVGGQLTVQGHFNLNGMDIYNNGWFYVAAGVLAGGNGLYSYAGLHADGACSIGGGLTVNGASSLAAVTVNGVETINGGSQAQSYHTVGSSAMLSFDNRNAPNNFGWYASSDWAYLWHSAAGNMFQFTNLNFAPVTGNSANCGMNGQAWGNVYSLGYPGSSSRNLKTDIAELSPALEKISALRAVQFRWRQDKVPDNRVHYGFVADEVATVIGEDWGGYHRDGEHEAVDKTELVAVLWKACQELAASNSALTTRVEALEARYVS